MAKKMIKKTSKAKEDPELLKWRGVAEDLNNCEELELDPPFAVEELSVDELKDQISDDTVIGVIKESMELEASTFEALTELGWKPKKKASKKAAPVEEDEEIEDVNTEETEEDEEGKPVKKNAKKAAPAKKEVKKSAPAKKSGPGVIDSIISILKKAPKAGFSTDAIAEKLGEIFPDREVDSMKGTVKVQCGGRLKSEKGLNVVSPEKGMYKIV